MARYSAEQFEQAPARLDDRLADVAKRFAHASQELFKNSLGLPPPGADAYDAAWFDLLFIADARAQVDRGDEQPRNQLWVPIARQAVIAANRSMSGVTLDANLDDQPRSTEIQRLDFAAMQAQRTATDGFELEHATGLPYATRVAWGGVVLLEHGFGAQEAA